MVSKYKVIKKQKEIIINVLKIESILNKMNAKEHYSIQEVYNLIDCSESSIYNNIKKRITSSIKIGRNYPLLFGYAICFFFYFF